MIRRLFLGLGAALALGLAALAYTFMPSDLSVPEPGALNLPPPMETEGVSVRAILTGKILTRAGMTYRGGSLVEERATGMSALLIKHPNGNVLIDTGLGRNVDAHYDVVSWLMRQVTRLVKEPPVADQLKAAGLSLNAVVITHAHWDHVSGAEDLTGVPVLMSEAELAFIDNGGAATELARRLKTKDHASFAWDGGAYWGFEKSHDVFGDGAVVAVPAPGHTPGSIFVFVTTSDGTRYVLVGDTAWQSEGVDRPAEKPWIARRLVDGQPQQVRDLLVRLNQLKRQVPGLIVLPAHDRRVWETLPRL
jgi:glyoxylase-like metal-dependent hydrolase (beta-lactamase superfamily II)